MDGIRKLYRLLKTGSNTTASPKFLQQVLLNPAPTWCGFAGLARAGERAQNVFEK